MEGLWGRNMRWSFHKRRNRRYQIALEELSKTFIEYQGADLLSITGSEQKLELTRKDKHLIQELDRMKECLVPYSKDYKKRHNHFLKILRRLLSKLDKMELQTPWQQRFQRLILELCKTKFYRIHLFLFGHHLLEDLFASIIHQKDISNLDFNNHFSQYSFLDESHLIMASRPLVFLERDLRQFNEMVAQAIFDPHKYNHPFLLYSFVLFRDKKPNRIKMIRMGTPTREGWGRAPVIIEEFQGLLKILKLENKNHLYVNKQQTWGKEGLRSYAIKSLEMQYDNFFCVSLPSDGAFYYQQMSYAHQEKAEEFKQTFLQLLIGKQCYGYYHFPKIWLENPLFVQGLQMVIEKVHYLFFEHKEVLSVSERRYFIDHTYTQIIIYCLQHFAIHSINITCRDGIDRAGCEQSKLLYYFQASLGIENEIESKIERQFLMHIPPYLAKNRPMVKERREYLYELMQNSYTPSVCREIYNNSKVDPVLYCKPHFVKRD